jgi:hypothetical protein
MTDTLGIASTDKSLLVLFFRKELLPYAFIFADLFLGQTLKLFGVRDSLFAITCVAFQGWKYQ